MSADGLWATKITKLTAGAKHIQRFFSADNKFVWDECWQISPKILKFASGQLNKFSVSVR